MVLQLSGWMFSDQTAVKKNWFMLVIAYFLTERLLTEANLLLPVATESSFRISKVGSIVMFDINSVKSLDLLKRLIKQLTLTSTVIIASGCQKAEHNPQGDVDTIGDAMSHCRQYTKAVLPEGTLIALDEWSSRETREYYDIYFDVSDSTQTGYAKCRVDKMGLITYHGTRDFRTKSRSFSGF